MAEITSLISKIQMPEGIYNLKDAILWELLQIRYDSESGTYVSDTLAGLQMNIDSSDTALVLPNTSSVENTTLVL